MNSFGSIAVLVTLVYLAFQTRQNTTAIGAQLDAARIGAMQNLFLSAATSSDLQEALAEDRIGDATINEARRGGFWLAQLLTYEWQLQQSRRGLLPTFNEIGTVAGVRALFTTSRSFESWWEGSRSLFPPEFVEWVEEQRAKAA